MTVSLIVMALWTSAVLAAGAWAADRLLRSARLQTRLIWMVAMATSVALVAVAPLRLWWSARSPTAQLLPAARSADSLVPHLSDVAALAAQRLPSWTGTALLSLWIVSGLLTLAAFVAGYRRHRQIVAASRAELLAGRVVRVSERFGPAVIGVTSPVVVIPEWLLGRSEEEQRLVIAHEREHIVTRDPLLLLVAAGLVVLMPWNPALWWCFSRLRLSTELDCDARVLRAGAPPRAYGALLLDLTAALPGGSVGAHAFAARPSQLEQRLLAMTTRPVTSRRRRATIVGASLVAAATLVTACSGEVKQPTVAEVPDANPAVVQSGLPYFDFQVEKPVAPIPGTGAPRYPAILRSAEVSGEVLAQFVVDTAGRVEIESFKVIRKSHDLFEASIRSALPAMRFTPAEIGGKKVRQLVQQPFVFQLAK